MQALVIAIGTAYKIDHRLYGWKAVRMGGSGSIAGRRRNAISGGAIDAGAAFLNINVEFR